MIRRIPQAVFNARSYTKAVTSAEIHNIAVEVGTEGSSFGTEHVDQQ